jgi:molybdopterin-biosynthesis enzyme MoeA-like protein
MIVCFSSGGNEAQAMLVSELLQKYCNASGQQINKEKSSIFFSKGVPEGARAILKQILEVMNESLSDRYLGLPSDVG